MSELRPTGRILLTAEGMNTDHWMKAFGHDRDLVLSPNGPSDPSIAYAVLWRYPRGLLKRLPNLKLIFSAGAGVDHIMDDPDLAKYQANVPILRIVSPNLTQHMVEYVTWRVLDHHRQGASYRSQQGNHHWNELAQPLASEITVGIMGFGQLGIAAAAALQKIGYKITGWSRSSKQTDLKDITHFYGDDGLAPFLNSTDILVVLLPMTPATEGIIDFKLLSQLRQDGPLGGPCLINAGRGRLQKASDILKALEKNILKEASLDVFDPEPLSSESPLWDHPRIFITPHAAASSNPDQLVPLMLAQMYAYENDAPLKNIVDPVAGY